MIQLTDKTLQGMIIAPAGTRIHSGFMNPGVYDTRILKNGQFVPDGYEAVLVDRGSPDRAAKWLIIEGGFYEGIDRMVSTFYRFDMNPLPELRKRFPLFRWEYSNPGETPAFGHDGISKFNWLITSHSHENTAGGREHAHVACRMITT